MPIERMWIMAVLVFGMASESRDQSSRGVIAGKREFGPAWPSPTGAERQIVLSVREGTNHEQERGQAR